MGIDAQVALPSARQRNTCLISKYEVKLFRLAKESAVRLCLEHSDRHPIALCSFDFPVQKK
jgi:hypothetical protein